MPTQTSTRFHRIFSNMPGVYCMIFYNKCCFLGQHDDLAIKEVQYSTIRMPDDFGISRVAKSSYWSKKENQQ